MIRRILSVVCIVVCTSASYADDKPLLGSWEGVLASGEARLTLRLHIREDETGALIGTMDSPDQGVAGLPITSVSWSGREIGIEIAAVAGRLSGRLL